MQMHEEKIMPISYGMDDNQPNVSEGWKLSISSTIHEVVFEKTVNRVVNNVTTKTAVEFTLNKIIY